MALRVDQPRVSEPPESFPANRVGKLRQQLDVDLIAHIADSNPHPIYLTQAEYEALQVAAIYALRYDQDADPPTVAYMGQATPGTATSAASWRIQKLVFGGDGDVTTTWADGNASFDNVWDDRASLTYS
jgi:hypothetical protein